MSGVFTVTLSRFKGEGVETEEEPVSTFGFRPDDSAPAFSYRRRAGPPRPPFPRFGTGVSTFFLALYDGFAFLSGSFD